MTNEELYEYYGWKASQKGFFNEWRNKTSSLMELDHELKRWDAGAQAYKYLIESYE